MKKLKELNNLNLAQRFMVGLIRYITELCEIIDDFVVRYSLSFSQIINNYQSCNLIFG